LLAARAHSLLFLLHTPTTPLPKEESLGLYLPVARSFSRAVDAKTLISSAPWGFLRSPMADLLQPAEAPANGAPPAETLPPAPGPGPGPGPGPKRQRRPSVRLGDIGEQPAAIPHEPLARRSKQWRVSSHLFTSPAGGGGPGKLPSRTRPLTNLVSEEPHDSLEIAVVSEDRGFHHGEDGLETMMGFRRGGREGKARRGVGLSARRVRTNWVSKVEEGADAAEFKSSGEDAGDERYMDYDDLRVEDSESPRAARARAPEVRETCPPTTAEVEDVDMPLEGDGREWSKGQCHLADGGVRAWLNGLGLGRYAPVFEIHEVDDEVLPLLTLEDLKDMGINAVGSRRKLYSAIQKLRRSFS
ncbi:hypothetical protein Taro_010447, partial [Colocasia esculenta]|nr:hypothetical protein [Colocasia esculenta]